jgi:hypothetical protein
LSASDDPAVEQVKFCVVYGKIYAGTARMNAAQRHFLEHARRLGAADALNYSKLPGVVETRAWRRRSSQFHAGGGKRKLVLERRLVPRGVDHAAHAVTTFLGFQLGPGDRRALVKDTMFGLRSPLADVPPAEFESRYLDPDVIAGMDREVPPPDALAGAGEPVATRGPAGVLSVEREGGNTLFWPSREISKRCLRVSAIFRPLNFLA